MRLVFVSDTHTLHDEMSRPVPDGDILVHCGDFTRRGDLHDVIYFNAWLGGLPHRKKVVVAGNHDGCFERDHNTARVILSNAVYLQDREAEVLGLRFYGSPWTPRFYDWAFNLDRGEPLRKVWAKIPESVDVLVTHGPPYGVLDLAPRDGAELEHTGCEELHDRVRVVKPAIHAFGHIHEGAGVLQTEHTLFVNAAICTRKYKPTNPPVVVDYDPTTRQAEVVK